MLVEPADLEECDVLVIGSGSAGLAAALRSAVAGLNVIILEKSGVLGGTSAMSGAGTWVPANHHAKDAGLVDSPADALTYLRAASPQGWESHEDALWGAFAENAPLMLTFLEQHSPLRFVLTEEPDVMSERPGGKQRGRMVSPRPLRKAILGAYAGKVRRSTLPHLYTYQEVYDGDLYHRPLHATLRIAHRLIWRLLTGSRAQGSALATGLLKGCLDHGCSIRLNSRVTRLLTDGIAVTGVLALSGGATRTICARHGVVLATGGFEWDPEMLSRYFPGPLDWLGSPRSNTGDGQRMAAEIGAALDNMDQANVYPAMPTAYEGAPHGIPVIFQAEPHAIVVDRTAKRFVSEYDFNIGEALDRRDADGQPVHLPAWVIADRRFLKQAPPVSWYARYKPGWLIKAASLEELAARTALSSVVLAATVARYNEFCRTGKDLDFHRGESRWEQFKAGGPDCAMAPIEQPPFCAMPLNRSILGTKGGARTNAQGQVLRADGTIIAGLYAAGLAMANPIGTRAVGPGTTIGPNLTWGFICGGTIIDGRRNSPH